jgi:c-di-GMP-binding flagellar brake protein YcgR
LEQEAVILDISLSGLCVSVPKESMPEIYEGARTSTFETSFMLPQEEKSIRIVCRPERVVPVNGSIHVGASFVDSDFTNYQQLQQYLV